MNWSFWLPLLVLASSLVTGLAIFPLPARRSNLRNTLNMCGASIKVVLVAVIAWGTVHGIDYETRLPLLPDYDLVLAVEPVSLLFASLSAVLWFFTTIYAIGYLRDSPNLSRFFGFFSLCVTAAVGVSLAGNLLTFVVFYELLTLTTYPLVVHRGTPEAVSAGRTYLVYTLVGGTLLLLAALWLYAIAGPVDFVSGGVLTHHAEGRPWELRALFLLLIAGLGVKAALVPLHGWLPRAMIAPAPVSALLHAVAVVKAGAFGIMRVIFDVFGVRLSSELGMSGALTVLAATTIILGSLMALLQDDLKRRLAYSTVSQLSYILLGIAMLGPLGTIGGLVHLVHQGLMKITLFFAAGNLSETLEVHRVSEMDGVARRMPLTMAAFTLAALGMIGLPPVAGFVSKWYLGLGALEQGAGWILWVLVASSLLNAGYFLPIIYRAWFRAPQRSVAPVHDRLEASWLLILPTMATAFMALAAGMFANASLSPLTLARQIVTEMYR
ncbi:MAG: proton-conducting transporter membrane subunit [Trueperaceae bacterium]